MARGRKSRLVITLSEEDRQRFQSWQRRTTFPAGLVRRARMVLLLADGHSISEVGRMVGAHRRFVEKWARRFLTEGIAGLADRQGRGGKAFFPSAGRSSSREDGL